MGTLYYCVLFLCTLFFNVSVQQVLDNNNEYGFINNTISKQATIKYANVTACDCGWANAPAQKRLEIAGGTETGVNQYPAMAALISVSSATLICGAHIISDRYLLTAGHCVYRKPASSLAVLVGDHNIATGSDTPYSAIYYVNAYEINPNFNSATYQNDIAILQTSTQILFSNYVGPICLPFKYSAASFVNQPVTILGWGQIEFSGPTSDVLLQAILNVLSNNVCAATLQTTVYPGELCTYSEGKDSCQSDSGGPVLWTDQSIARMYLVGIISHGIGCASSFPGVNTRVTTYLDWILSRTSDASYCYM